MPPICRPISMQCEHCHREYQSTEGPSHLARQAHHFCSRPCRDQWNALGLNPANGSKPLRICPQCKQPFRRQHTKYGQGQRYCGRGCYAKAREGVHTASIEMPCFQCGIPMWVTQNRLRKYGKVFCSRQCANQGHRGVLAGKNNGRYVHGEALAKYPATWTESLKEQVRNRDTMCVSCRMTPEESLAQTGRALDVHHVDYRKTHNTVDNLVTLCKWCHGMQHGGPASRKAWMKRWRAYLRTQQLPLFV